MERNAILGHLVPCPLPLATFSRSDMKPTTPKPINNTAPVRVLGPGGTGPNVICGSLHWAECLRTTHNRTPDCRLPVPRMLLPRWETPQGQHFRGKESQRVRCQPARKLHQMTPCFPPPPLHRSRSGTPNQCPGVTTSWATQIGSRRSKQKPVTLQISYKRLPVALMFVSSDYFYGRRGRNRTCNHRIRNPVLYPFELRAPYERIFVPSTKNTLVDRRTRRTRITDT